MNSLAATNISLSFERRPTVSSLNLEVVERKGIGHPDTISDAIAENISRAYSSYCLEKYGAIPNHWVDKCTLIGGACERQFGSGQVVSPIQIHVIGKVTHYIGNEEIPVMAIAQEAVASTLKEIFPHIKQDDYTIKLFTNHNWGAGRPQTWYAPQTVNDICPPEKATANDGVICTAYAPLSPTEKLSLHLEETLNGKAFKKNHPYIGTDIKVIACRRENHIHLTLCIPFISSLTPSREFYDQKKEEMIACILECAQTAFPQFAYTVNINTRDDEHTIYMTHLGSAADTGDVGVVGRGNRMNGLITPNRPQSIEAPCGKNPVYHTGKLYSVLAQLIADELAKTFASEVEVYITSETGNPLSKPSNLMINFFGKEEETLDQNKLMMIIDRHLKSTKEITHALIDGRIRLY